MEFSQLRIYFRTQDNRRWHLDYELFQNCFTPKWLQALQSALTSPTLYRSFNSDLYGVYFSSKEGIVESINNSISTVNSLGMEQIQLRASSDMGAEFLNELHSIFERLVVHPDFQPQAAGIEVYNALKNINVQIHRFESFFFSTHKGYIITRTNDEFSESFTEEDLKLFTPDNHFGYLYLPYQTVGISPLQGFYNKIEHQPTPQTRYTPSLHLSFDPDCEFSEYDEYENWLQKEKGLDPKDPKIPLGLIPLGKIKGALSREDIEKELYNTIALDEIVLLDNEGKERRPETQWPCGTILEEYLNYRPFIRVPHQFDHSKVLKEVRSLSDRFVTHRNYDQGSTSDTPSAEWKSLAIQSIDGDETKTEPFSVYRDYEGEYFLTEIAPHIPHTLDAIQSLTDIKQCKRIRFMLLEPGAAIYIHNDGPEREVSAAWNIAINHPWNCRFHIDLETDGIENKFSQEIPFTDGSTFLVNVSKNHYVVNDSNEPRYHIIVHGPSRVPVKDLIHAASEQSGITERRELLTKLYRKKINTIPEYLLSPQATEMHKSWASQGLGAESIPEDLRLIVVNHALPKNRDLESELLHKITRASLFPLPHIVVDANDLESKLTDYHREGVRGVALIASGNFFHDLFNFIPRFFAEIDSLIQRRETLATHLNHPTDKTKAIFAHEQFMLLNLSRWNELGSPKIGPRYGGMQRKYMPAIHAAAEHVHDDYTPIWVQKDSSAVAELQLFNWGSNLIAASLNAGERIQNIGLPLRETKTYTYPDCGDPSHLQRIREQIQSRIQSDQRFVYFFNNEPLQVAAPEKFFPEEFFFVAAGFKPLAVLNQFSPISKNAKIHFTDFSPQALDYIRNLPQASLEELTQYIFERMQADSFLGNRSVQNIQWEIENVVRTGFEGDYGALFRALNQIRSAEFSLLNLITDPDSFCDLVDPKRKTLFWHSNAWDTNSLRFQLTDSEIQESYENFGRLIARQDSSRVWRRRGGYDLIIGESFQSPRFYATGAGSPVLGVRHQEFDEIT